VLTVLIFCVISSMTGKDMKDQQDTWWLAFIGVLVTLFCLVTHYFYVYFPNTPESGRFDWLNTSVYMGIFQADIFSLLIRTLLVLGTLVVLLFTKRYVDDHTRVPGEFYVVLLSALLGGMLLSGAADLILVFVAIETLGISSYIMTGYLRGDERSAEASLKYLVYGGASTAVLLFGFSFLYGMTGSTIFEQMAPMLQTVSQNFSPAIPVMAVLIMAGLAFKLSVAPFHMWTPDVYEGAPVPVTAFLSVVSKIAGFAVAIRLISTVLFPIQGWFEVLAVMAVLSMVIGNVVALTQRNIKRLLAYSTISHVGYVFLGLMIMNTAGIASMLFYLVTYLFMNLGAFAIITHFGNLTGREDILAYAGLVRKRPFLALVFSIFLLSLAGMPITAGFFAKFFLFQSVAVAGDQYLWLVIVALITSTVGLYYYLNIIRLMVISEPSDAVGALPERPRNEMSFAMATAVAITLAGTLALGVAADPFMNFSEASAKALHIAEVNRADTVAQAR
jgi:NAD(P)H-quinone oxidoreductase subunit 2